MEKSASGSEGKQRQAYLDNVRSLVIILVVLMHSCVTYSGLGGWYYKENSADSLDIISKLLFGLYQSFSQAWFMGILFFLSAYWAAKSLAKRGAAAFIRERLLRLGIPLLVYMLAIEPFIRYCLLNPGNIRAKMGPGQAYLRYIASLSWLGSTGPLWFAEVLLIFSLGYVLFKRLSAKASEPSPSPDEGKGPSNKRMFFIIVLTAAAAFAIRLVFPIGSSVLNLQFGYFASYIALFALGIQAGERNWLQSFTETRGLGWFRGSLVAGLAFWFILVLASLAAGSRQWDGGLSWQSLAFALWESFVAIGFSLGLLGFFRKHVDTASPLAQLLARNSFGIYLFHAPVLIAISLLVKSWQAAPLVKALVVWAMTYTGTLLFSELVLRRIPGLKSLLR